MTPLTRFYIAFFFLIIVLPMLLCYLAIWMPYDEIPPFAEFAWGQEVRPAATGQGAGEGDEGGLDGAADVEAGRQEKSKPRSNAEAMRDGARKVKEKGEAKWHRERSRREGSGDDPLGMQ